MRTSRCTWIVVAIATVIFAGAASPQGGFDLPNIADVHAEIMATGIPGAGAIAQVGLFHKGGPFHDNATFAAATQPSQVLDAKRLLVASSSNFGAPLARPTEAPGSILSIDISAGPVA